MQEEKKEIPIAARFRGPGPGKYLLPGTCGYVDHDLTKSAKPAYSIAKRLQSQKKNKTPGFHYVPANVTRRGLDGSPSFSLYGLLHDFNKNGNPSPQTYYAEKVPPLRERRAPEYSMRARLDIINTNPNPAPNAYMPLMKAVKHSPPDYSMAARLKTSNSHETPGPGKYKVPPTQVYKRNAPSFTIAHRTNLPSEDGTTPGPNAHRPENVYVHKPGIPAFSMGIRHSEFMAPYMF